MTFDVFSSIDPGLLRIKNLPFILVALSIPIIIFIFSLKYNSWPLGTYLFSKIIDVITQQTARTSGKNISSFSSIIVTLFLFLIVLNTLGILPYVFRLTSQLIITLPLALTLWIALVTSSLIKDQHSVFAHFLPSGAPGWLNPFLILIEVISYIVRPITLAIRITANISTGHVVLSIIGAYNSRFLITSLIAAIIVILLQTGYILFEIAIALIQAYIFSLLLTLFSNDHPLLTWNIWFRPKQWHLVQVTLVV